MQYRIISLYGSYRGFLRLKENSDRLVVYKQGVPNNAKLFLVLRQKSRLVELKGDLVPLDINITDVLGAVIAIFKDNSWRIIMQGVVRGANIDMENIKRILWSDLNKRNISDEPPEQQSETLKQILTEADSLFSDEHTDRVETVQIKTNKSKNVFNPFYGTYPDSSWRKRRSPNGGIYLEGIARLAGERLHISAIPGSFFKNPQALERMGYTKYVKDDSGRGYWLRVRHIKHN